MQILSASFTQHTYRKHYKYSTFQQDSNYIQTQKLQRVGIYLFHVIYVHTYSACNVVLLRFNQNSKFEFKGPHGNSCLNLFMSYMIFRMTTLSEYKEAHVYTFVKNIYPSSHLIILNFFLFKQQIRKITFIYNIF